MNIIATIRESWELVVLIIGGIVSAIKYFHNKKVEKSSVGMLYQELENLKIKVITQVQKDIRLATEISQKEYIILELKKNCPDCYKKVLEKINVINERNTEQD